MAKYYGSNSKSLTGLGNLSPSLSSNVSDSIASLLGTGSIVFSNVTITSGTIDGVIIGSNSAGSSFYTSITIGNSTGGNSTSSCFYGNTASEYACWRAASGTWAIGGQLIVSGVSILGNISVFGNTITTANANGNLYLSPLGTLNIDSGITQGTSTGDLIFQTANGLYSLNTSKTNIFTSGTNTNINTTNGDINLTTGSSIPVIPITFITTGSSPTITTSTANNLSVGQKVTLSSTNSTPNLNGIYTVNSILSSTSFTVTAANPIISAGTSGILQQNNNILLAASNNINIPTNVNLTVGYNGSNPGLIYNDGTNTYLNGNNLVINGDLTVNGLTTYLNSTVTTVQEPVMQLGGSTPVTVSDNFNRGISANYYNNKTLFFGRDPSTGCFTYIPNATQVSPNVFTGAVGCANFGIVNATSINLNGGTIDNLPSLTTATLNTCNIVCNRAMNISSTNGISITSPYVNTSGTFTSSGLLTANNGLSVTGSTTTTNSFVTGNQSVQGISTVNSSIVLGNQTVNGTNTTVNSIVSGTSTINNSIVTGNESITGTLTVSGVTTLGTENATNINVSGTTNVNNLNITGVITGFAYSKEHLNILGGNSVSPSNSFDISFINVTSSGIATGNLQNGTLDGKIKYIFLSSCVSGGSYVLTATGNLIDAGSGTSATKKLTFGTAGQSIFIMWDNVVSAWMFINSGVCIS